MSGDSASLGARIARGAAWIAAARIVLRSLGLINTLILARLLVPADFGLVAVAVTVMQLLQNISDIGVSQTVVRFRDASRAHYDTLFTISLLRGVAVALLLLLASMAAPALVGDPRAGGVFVAVAIAPLLMALINPKFYEFEREIDFSKEFVTNAVNKLAGVVASVAIAVMFRTYWAIVVGLLVSAAVQLMLSYAARPYLPRLSFKALGDLLGFTGWLTGVSFMAALNNKLDVLLLGRLIGAGPTGVYYVGVQVAQTPGGEIATPLARAIYPGLSSLQNEQAQIRDAYLRGVEALAMIAMPASFGVALVAPEIVSVLLGEQWAAATPVLQYLTPAYGLLVLFYATQGFAIASGQIKTIFYREVIYFCIRMPAFVWAAITFGLRGAVIAAAAGVVLHVCLSLGVYARIAKRPIWEPLWRARRCFAGVAVMGVALLATSPVFEAPPDYIRLLIKATFGAGVYFLAVFALWRLEGKPNGIEHAIARRFTRA